MAKYGSLAISEDGISYGYSYGFSSEREAENRAINSCSGENPKIRLTKESSWVVLAMDGNGAWSWHSSSNPLTSRNKIKESGFNGQVYIVFHTGDGELDIKDGDFILEQQKCRSCGGSGNFREQKTGELISEASSYFKNNSLFSIFTEAVSTIGSTMGGSFICRSCNTQHQVCKKCGGLEIYVQSGPGGRRRKC